MKLLFFLFSFFTLICGQGTWIQLSPTGTLPPTLNAQTAIYVPGSNSMLMFGGYDGNTWLNSLWSYNISQKYWSELNPSGTLCPPRESHSAVYVLNSNFMYIFGGASGISGVYSFFNDLWKYDITNNVWTQLTSSGSIPGQRDGHSAVYSPLNSYMIIFGGWDGSSLYNDLWKYDITNNVWTELTPSGSIPTARCFAAVAYQSSSNLMIIFGGWNGSSNLNDLWKYDITNNIWTQLTPSGSIPPIRMGSSMVYVPNNILPFGNSLILFAGFNGQLTSVFGTYYSDLWQYDITNNVWTQLNPVSSIPSAREKTSAILVSTSNPSNILIYGGTNGGYFDDFWEYSFPLITTQQQTTQQQTTQQQTTQQQTTQQQTTTTNNTTTNNSTTHNSNTNNSTTNHSTTNNSTTHNSTTNKFDDKYYSKKEKPAFQVELNQLNNNLKSFIEFDLILSKEEIGEGHFGKVYKGKLAELNVACKSLINLVNAEQIMHENKILSELDHPNIVKVYGIKKYKGINYLVMEYMNGGSLLDFIRKYEKSLQEQDFFQMSLQIALGMEYLGTKNVLHRDLALRNILCGIEGSQIICKVCDFGLSKILPKNNEYYQTTQKQAIPIKWSAPELIFKEKISSKCDVFSFGVVLFEIFSKGQIPWAGRPNDEVLEALENKKRMPLPKDFGPPFIIRLIDECWKEDPDERPTFEELVQKLKMNHNSEYYLTQEIILSSTNPSQPTQMKFYF